MVDSFVQFSDRGLLCVLVETPLGGMLAFSSFYFVTN